MPTGRAAAVQEIANPVPTAYNASTTTYMSHNVSSSVPVRSTSTGPRLHDYGLGAGVVTQVGPGLVGVTTSAGRGVAVIGERANETNPSATQPVPVPGAGAGARHYHDAFGSVSSVGSAGYYRTQQTGVPESWDSHGYGSAGHHGLVTRGLYANGTPGSVNNGSGPGGWTTSKSSARSASTYSRSRSASRTRRTVSGSSESPPSDDESVDVDSFMGDGQDKVMDDRAVSVVIEEEEDEERGPEIDFGKADDGSAGMRTPRIGSTYSGLKYSGRTGPQTLAGGRVLRSSKRGREDLYGRHGSLREEDEEMEDAPIGRARVGHSAAAKEQQWDGMEMEMDMDMD